MDTDERRRRGMSSRTLAWSLLLVLLVVVAPVSAAEEVSASDALAAKEQATELRNELRSLDERAEVDVDGNVLATIDREIEKGNLTVDSGEYAEAKRHFDRAIEQARAELARSYDEGTRTILNGTDGHLRSLREQGYATAEIGVLEERITKQQRKLGTTDDLESSRSVYANARSIRTDAEDLPRPGVVRAVSLLTSVWWLLLATVVVALAAVGWYVRTNDDGNGGPQLH